MSCVVYKNDGPYSGSIEISGTTCAGSTGWFYLNFGDSICMDTSQPLFTCDYFKIEGPCNTPTNTPSPTRTPTQTPSLTPSTTPNVCQRFRVDFAGGIPSAYYSLYQPYTPGYTSWNGFTGLSASCVFVCSATSAGTQYAVFRNETNPNYFAIYNEQVGKFRFWQFPTFSSCGYSWNCGGVLYGAIPTGFTYNGLVYPTSGIFPAAPGSQAGVITGITYDNCYPIVTQTMTPTNTNTPSITPSNTATPQNSATPTVTPTNTTTVTPTKTATPSITPSNTPSGSSGNLYVYAKYQNAEQILQYQVNGGSVIQIGNIDSLTCQYFYTITGLTNGDSIDFTTLSTCVLAQSNSTCPNTGFSCTQNYVFPGGNQYIYITVDGSNCC
jgi:hypothetical protein